MLSVVTFRKDIWRSSNWRSALVWQLFLCYAITFGALMAIWWNGGEEVCRPGAGGGQAAYWCRPVSLDTKTIWKYFR